MDPETDNKQWLIRITDETIEKLKLFGMSDEDATMKGLQLVIQAVTDVYSGKVTIKDYPLPQNSRK